MPAPPGRPATVQVSLHRAWRACVGRPVQQHQEV